MTRAGDTRVVVAYDGSDPAKEAIESAGRLMAPGTKAIVVTVWEPLNAIPFWGAPLGAVPKTVFEEVISRAKEVAAEGALVATAAGFEAESKAREGSPIWRAITREAEERGAELIVIGSHGRTGVSYVLAGSVATAVTQHAKCSVLVGRAGVS